MRSILMRTLIKENISLVVALALPLLFAGFFFVSKQFSISNVPPPRYDFVLAPDNYGYFQIDIVDGALKARFTYPRRDERGYTPQVQAPEIYYINHETMVAERIDLPLPGDANNPAPGKDGASVDIPVKKLEGVKITSSSISPDGYELVTGSYRSGNLMTEIFAENSYNYSGLAIQKDGMRKDIKGVNQNYNLRIVGWIDK